jgi:PadR family transcriptional regulator
VAGSPLPSSSRFRNAVMSSSSGSTPLARRRATQADTARVWHELGVRPALDYTKISSYSWTMPRRKPGDLLGLETEILDAALSMRRSGQPVFHGFALARDLREKSGSRALTSHGTLYKALGRLEDFGLLTSHWEDAAAVAGRPRRRLYELTAAGLQAADPARRDSPVPATLRVRPGIA